jgi:hypothetical protein
MQKTTGLGLGGLGTGITNLLALFGDCKLGGVIEKIPELNFTSTMSAILLIIAGIISIVYNEDKFLGKK